MGTHWQLHNPSKPKLLDHLQFQIQRRLRHRPTKLKSQLQMKASLLMCKFMRSAVPADGYLTLSGFNATATLSRGCDALLNSCQFAYCEYAAAYCGFVHVCVQ